MGHKPLQRMYLSVMSLGLAIGSMRGVFLTWLVPGISSSAGGLKGPMGIIGDGARFRNPTKETQVVLVWMPHVRSGKVLPIQVVGPHEIVDWGWRCVRLDSKHLSRTPRGISTVKVSNLGSAGLRNS